MDIFWLKSVSNFYNQIKLKVPFRPPLVGCGGWRARERVDMKWVLLETVGMVRRLPAASFISSFIQNNRQWHTAVCDTQCGVHLHVTRGDWVESGEATGGAWEEFR